MCDGQVKPIDNHHPPLEISHISLETSYYLNPHNVLILTHVNRTNSNYLVLIGTKILVRNNVNVEIFYIILNSLFCSFVPLKYIKHHKFPSWFSNPLTKVIKEKNGIFLNGKSTKIYQTINILCC